MIISPSRKYIFVHIPKTGGTSMAIALENRAKADDILIGDTPKAKRRRNRLKTLKPAGRLWKHSRLSDIEGLEQAEPISDYFVFTMVRDPWDRIFSLYNWLRLQNFDHSSVSISKTTSFTEFLNHPFMTRSLSNDQSSTYLTRKQGSYARRAFVRLEHLSEDLPVIEDELSLKLAPLPHQNAGPANSGSRREYSSVDAERVAEWFADDIQKFGYVF